MICIMILKIKYYINMINNIIFILKLLLLFKIINKDIINSIYLNYHIKYYMI